MSFVSGGGGSGKWSAITIDVDKDMGGKGLSNLKQVAAAMVGGDLIAKGLGGILVRIPAGIANTVLTSQGALMLPVWAPGGLYLNRYFPANINLGAPVITKNTIPTHQKNFASNAVTSVYVLETNTDDPANMVKLLNPAITLPGTQTKNTIPSHSKSFTMTSNLPSQYDLITVVESAQAYKNGTGYTDETTAAQNVTANDMTIMQAAPAVNDAYYYGHPKLFDILTLVLGTSGVWTGSLTWEYWNGAWTAIPGFSDLTTNYTAAPGTYKMPFTQPGDWATTTVNTMTEYWIRARVSAFTGIITQAKGTQALITISSHPIF
jgi:hypothetical protein